MDRLSAIVDAVEDGKGTIGKLFVDDELVQQLAWRSDDKFKQLASDLTRFINSSDNSVGKLLHDNGALYDDVHDIVTQTNGVVRRINTMVDGVNSGKGTLGQAPQEIPRVRRYRADSGRRARDCWPESRRARNGRQAPEDATNSAIRLSPPWRKSTRCWTRSTTARAPSARLLNDPALFEDLDGVTRETQGLIKDFRANPKKFLRIKLGCFSERCAR